MKIKRSSVNFADIDVWTKAKFFTDDDKGGERLLQVYNETVAGRQLDLSGEGEYIVAARDRPPCGVCAGCKQVGNETCINHWYPAHLSIYNCAHNGQKEKLAIVIFPGWPLPPQNQQHEYYLLRRLQNNDQALINDYNIRLFRWNELYQLAGNIGQIRTPIKVAPA
jgi:hypothetical protein